LYILSFGETLCKRRKTSDIVGFPKK